MDADSRDIRRNTDTFNVVWKRRKRKRRKECNPQLTVPKMMEEQ
jgi:hypothetical protein